MSKTTEPTPQEPLGDSEGTATSAVVGLDPVAFMTHHDDPMLFPTWGEAVQYCDDDESPISLFHADDVAKLQADLAAMTQERDELRKVLGFVLSNPSEEAYWLTQLQAVLGEKK